MQDLLDNLSKLFVGIFLRWLFTKLPGLAWGPIGFVVTEVVFWVLTNSMRKTVIGGMFLWLDWDTKLELNAVEKALKDIYDFKGKMTGDDVEVYENNLSDAYYNLIEFYVPSFRSVFVARETSRLRGMRRFDYNWRSRVYDHNFKAA